VCHLDPLKRLLPACIVGSLVTGALFAQADWRRIGGSTFDAGLASPATGAVTAVWFSPDGGKLTVRTGSGATWESADLNSWSPATITEPRLKQPGASPNLHLPESSARTVVGSGGAIYALGMNLFRSDDNGLSWTNLTAFRGRSVIGPGQNDIAVSPRDPQTIYVANAWGLWASHDGGLSWSGLNDNLPNLHIKEIISAGNTIAVSMDELGPALWRPGNSSWEFESSTAAEAVRLEQAAVSSRLKATIRALNGAGDTWYAGSTDGRLWVSRDNKSTWTVSPTVAGGPVERIFVDPDQPNIAFAAASGKTRSILRTINAGQFWDDITGGLTETAAHGIAADRASGAIYVATDRGVFIARADLNALGPVLPWTAVTGLPNQPAVDVRLSGTRLYAAIDGYGVFVRSTPQLTGTMRLVSAADQSERAAAPGSLFSIVGRRVQTANAGSLRIPILASSAEESQIQVPFEATGSELSLTLDQIVTSVALKPVSPAIFLDRDGAPMLLDADTGLMMEPRSSLHARSRIQVLATGLGKTEPFWPTAVPAPAENPPAVSASVQAFLNGTPVTVSRATLAPGYVGLYVVELELPALLDAGAAELLLTADGQESNRVRIFLQSEI
jgi:uncharacterized protein (TIGR03437 family)